MFKTIKNAIIDTAYSAVMKAETAFENGSGKQKKELAIKFIISKLPVVQPFKAIIALFLSKFIDKSIEQAVIYMKNIQSEQER